MSRISIDDLEKYLWGSAELLRTNIDAGAYKQYIFPLLFLKRMSDIYDEESEKAIAEYGEVALEWDETHIFDIPQGAHWEDVRNKSQNIGKALVAAFRKIEKANPDKLQGIFGDAAWTNKDRLPDRLLKDLIEHFSSQTLSLENCPEDELGQGYEYLVKKFADDSGHTAQEFYTNRTVVRLMTEILKPRSEESIYDPTCGSAGMLISCIQYLKDHNQEWRNVAAYGQEINNLTSAIGKMNLFLHGVNDFQIANGDTLKNPSFIEHGKLKTFDIVLANPPYSISQWDRAAFETDKYGRNFFGVPTQRRADFAFIQHILKSMDPINGRCAILLPNGVLNRYEEQDMRIGMVKADYVDAVINIGKGLFYNSPMEACVMICRTQKAPERKDKIIFIDATDQVAKRGTESYLTDENIRTIQEAYFAYHDIESLCSVRTVNEVLDNNGSLRVQLYVHRESGGIDVEFIPYENAIRNWESSSSRMHAYYESLVKLMEGTGNDR